MTRMIIIFPVGQRDCMLASWLVRYLRDIQMPPTHEAVIVYRSCEASWTRQIAVLAGTVFANVVEVEADDKLPDPSWPHAPNLLHRTSAEWVQENRPDSPWFWFEPDCTPLVPNWVDVMEDEYRFNGTPFTGNIQEPGPKDTYWKHVSGCRISPGDFFGSYSWIYDGLERAFDLEASDQIIAETTQTHRMKHEYFIDTAEDIILEKGKPGGYSKIIPKGYVLPTFTRDGMVDELIRGGYVIQHRCKDGSLIKWARKYHGLD